MDVSILRPPPHLYEGLHRCRVGVTRTNRGLLACLLFLINVIPFVSIALRTGRSSLEIDNAAVKLTMRPSGKQGAVLFSYADAAHSIGVTVL